MTDGLTGFPGAIERLVNPLYESSETSSGDWLDSAGPMSPAPLLPEQPGLELALDPEPESIDLLSQQFVGASTDGGSGDPVSASEGGGLDPGFVDGSASEESLVLVATEPVAPGTVTDMVELAPARSTNGISESPNPHDPDTAKFAEHTALMNLVHPEDATHVALADGDWFDPATWGGEVPGDGARVLIPRGVSVDYTGLSEAWLFTVRVDGELSFATQSDSRMVVDTVVVTKGGRLEIGTASDPVAAGVSAEIVIANGGAIDVAWDPMLLSRGIISHGAVEMHGAEKDTHLKVDRDPMAGDIALTLVEAPEGWQAGDRIVIAGTRYDGHKYPAWVPPEDEVRTIVSIDGNLVTLDAPLVHDHDAPRPDLRTSVANYSRSITIATEDPESAAVHERGHVMFMHSDDVDVRYVSFDGLGRTDKSIDAMPAASLEIPMPDANVKGRYALHVHRSGLEDPVNPAMLVGNAVWDSPGWGIVHHDSNAVLHANATYDTFGAGFVAESGNETGSWTDNIAIYSKGIGWMSPKDGTAHSIHENFDLGRTGDGFWFQGRMVEASGNVAASVNTGFVYMHRGATGDGKMMSFDAETFDFPEALGLDPSVKPDAAPILHFADNETFAARGGLQIVKANPNQGHEIHSHLVNFKAWNVLQGIDMGYTQHYILENIDLVAREPAQYSTPKAGLYLGTNVLGITILDPRIEGFATGIEAIRNFTRNNDADPGNDLTTEDIGYLLVGGTFTGNDQDLIGVGPEETTLPKDAVPGQFSVDLKTSLVNATPGSFHVSVTGTKTDSLGTVTLPAGTDTLDIDVWTAIRILEQDGWYQTRDGQRFFVLEGYYSDRGTGEIHKIGHLVEIDPIVQLGANNAFRNAKFNGFIDLASAAPVTAGETVATGTGQDLVIDLLANDSDPEGAMLRVDGIFQPLHGKVFENANGTVTYRPDIGFTGTDAFRYWVTDGQGNFTPAEVTIEVQEAEDHGQAPIDAGGGSFDTAGLLVPGTGLVIEAISTGTEGDAAAAAPPVDGPMTDESYLISAEAMSLTLLNASAIIGTPGDDTMTGAGALEIFDGAEGDDALRGGDGLDTLFGGPGDDDLDAGAGTADGYQLLAGGDGADTYRIGEEAGGVIIAADAETAGGGGTDRVVFDDLARGDVTVIVREGAATGALVLWDDTAVSGVLDIHHDLELIESFVFVDGPIDAATLASEPDHIAFYGNADGGVLQGTEGADFLYGGAGIDNLLSGSGDDLLSPGAGSLTETQNLYGESGNDTYLIGRESGSIRISTYAEQATTGEADRVVFDDLNRNDIRGGLVDTSGSDGRLLSLNWDVSGVKGYLSIAHEGTFIEAFEFADGRTFSSGDLIEV